MHMGKVSLVIAWFLYLALLVLYLALLQDKFIIRLINVLLHIIYIFWENAHEQCKACKSLILTHFVS